MKYYMIMIYLGKLIIPEYADATKWHPYNGAKYKDKAEALKWMEKLKKRPEFAGVTFKITEFEEVSDD